MYYIRILFTLMALLVSTLLYAGPVDLNTADIQSLATNIKGIGAKKAAAIVAYREAHGNFKRVDDLLQVKGIGQKLLDKNREILMVNLKK